MQRRSCEWGSQTDFDPETRDGEPEVRLGGGRPARAQTGLGEWAADSPHFHRAEWIRTLKDHLP